MIEGYRARCTPRKKQGCARANGPFLEVACRRCPGKEIKRSVWLEHLTWLRALQQGGCPIGVDDLDLTTWNDLGTLAMELNRGRINA